MFVPENITAQVGDVVKFEFWPTNNSVARSDFGYPCIPYELTGTSRAESSFWSGFQPIVANLAQVNITELPAYYIVINRVTPLWFYNSAPDACIKYQMVGVINPVSRSPSPPPILPSPPPIPSFFLNVRLTNRPGFVQHQASPTQLAVQKRAAAAATLALSPGEALPQGSTLSSSSSSTPNATASATPTSTPSSSKSVSPGAIAGIAIGCLVSSALVGAGICPYAVSPPWTPPPVWHAQTGRQAVVSELSAYGELRKDQ
ncbi:hypothetical protein DBV05_g9449 [Lasiodiplodia theobromae]|uniref:Uncharacterized protein n=1 Tax=Lasiodiplodia theobromae TaxID=45133 RepID=A0A5N5D2G9_9PEZI|nr:hypothetical protein DBV05_g9449 [Lasiodiplodia theobromae]